MPIADGSLIVLRSVLCFGSLTRICGEMLIATREVVFLRAVSTLLVSLQNRRSWSKQGWEFTLWFFFPIAHFLTKRANHSFRSFCKGRREWIGRFALLVKSINHSLFYKNKAKNSMRSKAHSWKEQSPLIKRVNRSFIKSESLLC